MTLEEIKKAVLEGKTVHWVNVGYVVQKWKNGGFYVVFLNNGNAVGLDYENKLQGEENDFFMVEFKTCDACGGSGFDAIEERRPCFTCDGLGRIEL